jgi:hypothetical protein
MSSLVLLVFLLAGIILSACPVLADDSSGDIQCTMITFVAPVRPLTQTYLTSETMNHYLPPGNLTPTTDSNHVFSQVQATVEQKLVDDFSKSDFFRKSSIGKTTTQMESLSQTSVAVSKKAKLDFKVKLVERQIVVTYQGLLKSEIIYTMSQGMIQWVLSQPIGKTTNIAFTNSASAAGASSILSLNHSF